MDDQMQTNPTVPVDDQAQSTNQPMSDALDPAVTPAPAPIAENEITPHSPAPTTIQDETPTMPPVDEPVIQPAPSVTPIESDEQITPDEMKESTVNFDQTPQASEPKTAEEMPDVPAAPSSPAMTPPVDSQSAEIPATPVSPEIPTTEE